MLMILLDGAVLRLSLIKCDVHIYETNSKKSLSSINLEHKLYKKQRPDNTSGR